MSTEYKNEYRPDHISFPGVTLLETINALGMTQVELAERTGRSPKDINRIIRGNARITPETAILL
ncbi:MAG: helix-turn-helix domain-containing protein, partial [candidate division Zixibacteria bacterium]|nr:helix-turn-helix domain-containing protein [candidate division Zixibacteria bacterium]